MLTKLCMIINCLMMGASDTSDEETDIDTTEDRGIVFNCVIHSIPILRPMSIGLQLHIRGVSLPEGGLTTLYFYKIFPMI